MKTELTEALKNCIERIAKDFYSDIELDVNSLPVLFEESLKQAFQEGQSNPKIKELEWIHGAYEEAVIEYHTANTPFGCYEIIFMLEDMRIYISYNQRDPLWGYIRSVDAAKELAKQHYEATVKQCLEI